MLPGNCVCTLKFHCWTVGISSVRAQLRRRAVDLGLRTKSCGAAGAGRGGREPLSGIVLEGFNWSLGSEMPPKPKKGGLFVMRRATPRAFVLSVKDAQ